MGSVARYESDHKSARLRRKHEQLAQMGKLAGGGSARPFGYEKGRRTIIATEASLIRDGARRILVTIREYRQRDGPLRARSGPRQPALTLRG